MNQKNFGVVFIILLIIGIGVISFNRFTTPSTPPSPSASDNNALDFNDGSSSGSAQATATPLSSTRARTYKDFPVLTPAQLSNKTAIIQTSKGEIDFEIYPEATKAASSFIFLAGNSFFDGLTFHRVVAGFVIQGGDPTGTGRGGPGYEFADELSDSKTYTRGTVAMANAGPNTNGSQFFIMLQDHPELPKSYTIFGKVNKGLDVVDKIAVGDVMTKVVVK